MIWPVCALRLGGVRGRVVQTATAGVMVAAKGGKHAGFGKGEADHLLHDA